MFIFFISCTQGNYKENQRKLDDLFGECRNPSKPLSEKKYEQCMAKQRAEGETLFDIGQDINNLISGKNNNIIYQNSVNPFLWKAALEITSTYPLKIADNQGGYIETDWIIDAEKQNQRCLIKIRILSQELVSNGVLTNLICEYKENENWKRDLKNYFNEEKQLTLQILKTASNFSDISPQ